MKKLSLHPYPGEVWLCKSLAEWRRAHKKKSGTAPSAAETPDELGGMTCCLGGELLEERVYLVYGLAVPILAHEFGHVLLDLFASIGHNPVKGDGEPFCYLLQSLIEEATK